VHLSALYLYPVKSLRGFAVDSAEVDALGLVGDRRFLIVDAHGQFLTQRTLPRMAQIATALSADTLTLSADGHGSISIPRETPPDNTPAHITVSIWRSKNLLADDCGPEPAAWLSSFLQTPVRLVRIGQHFRRPVLYKSAFAPPSLPANTPRVENRLVGDDLVTFADGYPFLVASESSLDQLNDRLISRGADPVPMDRFRPNLVLSGCEPFAEDTWPRLQIGDIAFRAAGPCSRCAITTTDQLTGEREGPEPLRTLATFRRDPADPTDVNFGQNLVHETKSGTLRVGAAVHLIDAPK